MRTARTPARRSPGRPIPSADNNAREALLDAAVALFAEQGAAATTSAGIATRAGVTPAMVHYYFRGRQRLLDAVVDERLARFVAHVFAPPLPIGNGGAAVVEHIVHRIFEAADRMPWMPPIWIRDIVSEGGSLRDRMLRRFPAGAVGSLVAVLSLERRSRRIPAGIEPRLAFLTIAGVAMLPLATRALWTRMPGLADLSDAQLRRHALAVLTSGLAPSSGAERRKR
jgi:AcrR family transcriptional regulator